MRAKAKRDDNHAEIVQALRDIGCSVQDLAAVGGGCPDLLVGFRGRNLAIEVKDGSKPPSARRLTPDQVRWHEEWRGEAHVVTSAAEAVRIMSQASPAPR